MTDLDEFEHCQELIAKGRILPNGCIAAQGAVNDKGYIQIRFKGKAWLVHRFVCLYHIKRTEEQIMNLLPHKVRQTCSLTICINPAHLEFNDRKPEKQWEPRVDWWKTPLERVNSGY